MYSAPAYHETDDPGIVKSFSWYYIPRSKNVRSLEELKEFSEDFLSKHYYFLLAAAPG